MYVSGTFKFRDRALPVPLHRAILNSNAPGSKKVLGQNDVDGSRHPQGPWWVGGHLDLWVSTATHPPCRARPADELLGGPQVGPPIGGLAETARMVSGASRAGALVSVDSG